MAGKQREKKEKTAKRRLEIHEVTAENDIRYRGPLNYQHLQIIGWLCIAAAQAAAVLNIGRRLDEGLAQDTESLAATLSSIANMALPFLLIANFARILNASEGYKKQLIKNAAAAAGIAAGSILMYYHYVVETIQAVSAEPGNVTAALDAWIQRVAPHGFIDFNIFVDLLLCTLVMIFLNYRPTRIFRGKSVIIFRLFTLLPIAYEVFSMVLKIRAARGAIILPVWSFPLLTVKPPMTFVLFVVLALFVKRRERRFIRHGKTHEEYQAFLKTNRNSRNFSAFLALMIVVVCIVDILALVFMSAREAVLDYGNEVLLAEGDAITDIDEDLIAGMAEEETETEWMVTDLPEEADHDEEADEWEEMMEKTVRSMTAVGFGESISLLFLVPLVMLFSYTRKPRSTVIGMIIPLAGILLIIFIWLEGGHQLIITAIPRLNLQQVFRDVGESMSGI